MKLYDSFRSALQSLVVNKLRSALTMLGVIIGVAAVIAMVSVGNGASQSVQNAILNLGSNLVTVQPQFGNDQGLRGAGAQAQNLTLDDMRSIQDQLGASISAIEAEQGAGRWQVTAAGQNWNTQVTGVTESYPQVRDWALDSGDFFTTSDVNSIMLQRHKISDPANADFTVTNQNDTLAALSSVTGTFTLLLGAIGGISLLVGGIGIMNIMLVSVNERTREIGIRKAVGARRGDILVQFLIEAIALTGLGGVLGILLGWGITEVVHRIPQAASLPLLITSGTVIIAVGVSVAIGVVFGLYPAMRAARLHPIQALRYE